MALRLGIDVGGTFTDLFLHDDASGEFWLAKTPSTPEDQSIGVLAGTREVCERAAIDPARLEVILHGTTVATNAVLEGKGARVGLLVTQGWAHLMHLAESWTPGPLFGFFNYIKPEPLVEFEDIREVPERLDSAGKELAPLDEAATRAAIEELGEAGIEALTVCLLNSYANPAHEQRVEDIAQAALGEIPVSISSNITPEFREYARAVTTVMNSYVGPVLSRYLSSLEQKLVESEIAAPLQVVRSDGGLQSLAAAREHPVQTVLSGPSGGVNGAAFVAHRAGHDGILTFDMGGTSTDVAVCVGGAPTITRETQVGSFPVRAPSVDVESIGAGGGSIASVSPVTGALRVGPESAGAVPGPAAYGRGGEEPTVTDANVVLGHLPPVLLGGAMTLDVDAAHAAVTKTAEAMGVDAPRAAERDRLHRQREHARCAARRDRAEGPRPDRVRARRIRRGRRAPRQRRGRDARRLPGDHPAGARRSLGARLRCRRRQKRVRSDAHRGRRSASMPARLPGCWVPSVARLTNGWPARASKAMRARSRM